MATFEDELIGTLIEFPHMYEEYKHDVTPELTPVYTKILKVMADAADNEGVSYRAIVSRLDFNEIGIVEDLRRLAHSENRIPLLVEHCKRNRLRKDLVEVSERIRETINTDDPDDILRALQSHVEALNTSGMGKLPNSVADVNEVMDFIEAIHKDPSIAFGMLCGVPDIDRMTNGWQRNEMSVIGARTSMGKSLFLIDQALRVHLNGYKVAIFSLEMSKRTVYMRMMSNLMQTDFKHTKQGRQTPFTVENMKKAKSQLYGITVFDDRGVDAEFIADRMYALKRKEGLDLVIVDYLQDVKERGEQNDNGGSALARVCRKIRKAAKDCDCHVMAASQVVRSVEDRQDKRPGSADLSGSTGIETSADTIAMLYRDEYYNPESGRKGILEINFTKQRNGECGKVETAVNLTTQRISQLIR